MSTILYLMRHGETLFNVMRKMQGWCDSPLTADGIAQAKTAGAYLREQGLSFDYHCSSTLERACDTLETIMGELYGEVLPYERFKDLREHGFGMFEGVRYDIPPGRTLLERGDAEGVDIIHLLQGEDQRNVGPRMFRCLSQIMDQPGRKRVLAVSSMDSINLFLTHIGDALPEPHALLNNCCVCVLDYDPARERPFQLQDIIRTNDRDILIEQ